VSGVFRWSLWTRLIVAFVGVALLATV